jgi:hypothetical protein
MTYYTPFPSHTRSYNDASLLSGRYTGCRQGTQHQKIRTPLQIEPEKIARNKKL